MSKQISANRKLIILEELCKITDGAHKTPTYSERGIPFLRVTDIRNDQIDIDSCKRIPIQEHIELCKRCKPEKGDILLSKNGTIGIAKLIDWEWDFSIFVSLALIKIRDQEVLNPNYLEFIFSSPFVKNQIFSTSKQGTVTNLHLEEIRKLKVPIYPIPDQKKIAEILSGIDKLILDINKVIDKLNLLKISITKKLMRKGINNDTFKNTSLGCIPDSWKLVKGIDCLSLGSGISPSSIKFSKQGEILYMKVDDFNNPENNVHIKTTKLRLKNSDNPKVRPYLKGTVVIAKRGAAIQQNRVRLLTQKTYVDTNLMTIIPNGFLSEFFAIYLKNENINSLADATSVPQINNFHLNDYIFAMPPINEQKQIVQVLGSISNKIELNIKKLSIAKSLKQSLMQDLLSGRVRVNI